MPEEQIALESNRGEQLFVACQGCHSIAAGAEHRVGPNLQGMMDQPAATRPGYTYSDELQNAGLTWTDSMLAAWIVDTETIVPGTWMAYSSILEGDEIQTLIEYIRQASSTDQE